MNRLPATILATRLNALAAAAVVTLTLLAVIGGLASAENAAMQLTQAAAGHRA